MSAIDTDYYQKRAEGERLLAAASPTDEVAALHEELAGQYEALVGEPGLQSSLRIKWSAPRFDHPPTPRDVAAS